MSRFKKNPRETLLGGEPIEAFGRVNVLRHEDEGTRLLGVAEPQELQDRQQFVARFGGGSYTLVARRPDNRRIAARFQLAVEGTPKPVAGAPLSKPTGRRPSVDPSAERSQGTTAGALEAIVFRMLRGGATLEQVVDETHVPSRVLRGIYLEWLTDFGEEPPKTREEILERAKARRERRMHAWDRTSAERSE